MTSQTLSPPQLNTLQIEIDRREGLKRMIDFYRDQLRSGA